MPDHTEEKAKEVSVDRESEADLKVKHVFFIDIYPPCSLVLLLR